MCVFYLMSRYNGNKKSGFKGNKEAQRLNQFLIGELTIKKKNILHQNLNEFVLLVSLEPLSAF